MKWREGKKNQPEIHSDALGTLLQTLRVRWWLCKSEEQQDVVSSALSGSN